LSLSSALPPFATMGRRESGQYSTESDLPQVGLNCLKLDRRERQDWAVTEQVGLFEEDFEDSGAQFVVLDSRYGE
jgi:hypothetical protein